MASYYISTDSCSVEIDAENADAAACEFAQDEGIKGVASAADLQTYLERVGGYGFMETEDGEMIFRIPA